MIKKSIWIAIKSYCSINECFWWLPAKKNTSEITLINEREKITFTACNVHCALSVGLWNVHYRCVCLYSIHTRTLCTRTVHDPFQLNLHHEIFIWTVHSVHVLNTQYPFFVYIFQPWWRHIENAALSLSLAKCEATKSRKTVMIRFSMLQQQM